MNTHNATKYPTKVGTFQVKYSPYGGRLGSCSCKLSELKKVYVPALTARQLVEEALRINRVWVERLEIRVHVAFTIHDLAVAEALKEYVV
jgi:hypothetical protein